MLKTPAVLVAFLLAAATPGFAATIDDYMNGGSRPTYRQAPAPAAKKRQKQPLLLENSGGRTTISTEGATLIELSPDGDHYTYRFEVTDTDAKKAWRVMKFIDNSRGYMLYGFTDYDSPGARYKGILWLAPDTGTGRAPDRWPYGVEVREVPDSRQQQN